MIMRIVSLYKEYCDKWLKGMNKPTIVVALFMKYMEEYRRCVDRTKDGNTWLMEIEG